MTDPAAAATLAEGLVSALAGVIRGKRETLELLVVGLLAEGHVLIEDVPGVGKTTLAKALAKALSVRMARVLSAATPTRLALVRGSAELRAALSDHLTCAGDL